MVLPLVFIAKIVIACAIYINKLFNRKLILLAKSFLGKLIKFPSQFSAISSLSFSSFCGSRSIKKQATLNRDKGMEIPAITLSHPSCDLHGEANVAGRFFQKIWKFNRLHKNDSVSRMTIVLNYESVHGS